MGVEIQELDSRTEESSMKIPFCKNCAVNTFLQVQYCTPSIYLCMCINQVSDVVGMKLPNRKIPRYRNVIKASNFNRS